MSLMDRFRAKSEPEEGASRPATARDVVNAYRILLGREPDENGLSSYGEQLRGGLTVDALLRSILNSTEYLALGPDVSLPPALLTPAPDDSAAPPAPELPPDYISPADVIARLSLEDLIATSDEYYRRVPDATPLMSKPFTFLHEAPEALQSLGHLLAGLHLGKTMRVLDFGAGTCWLSRMLTQLNCQVICCDVSSAALEIGRRLFADYPLIGTAVYAPVFLPFNGRRIDLPDASVDRIVCFDAFHHVPNPDEVVREFGRILTPGGLAGFSEPGRFHSRSAQSQYEMRHHRVLENDIDLDAISEMARAAGFTALTTRMLADREIDLDEYRRIAEGRADAAQDAAVRAAVRDAMISRSVFFLHKGDRRLDSRSHVGLSHSLTIAADRRSVAPGERFRITATASNTGAAHWLHTNAEIFGIVRLAAHLYSGDDGRLIDLDFFRHDLPRPVAPGETIALQADVVVESPGRFRLVFDLVAEGVTWFENVGASTAEIEMTVRPPARDRATAP